MANLPRINELIEPHLCSKTGMALWIEIVRAIVHSTASDALSYSGLMSDRFGFERTLTKCGRSGLLMYNIGNVVIAVSVFADSATQAVLIECSSTEFSPSTISVVPSDLFKIEGHGETVKVVFSDALHSLTRNIMRELLDRRALCNATSALPKTDEKSRPSPIQPVFPGMNMSFMPTNVPFPSMGMGISRVGTWPEPPKPSSSDRADLA